MTVQPPYTTLTDESVVPTLSSYESPNADWSSALQRRLAAVEDTSNVALGNEQATAARAKTAAWGTQQNQLATMGLPANNTAYGVNAAGGTDLRNNIIKFAQQYVGTPYKWGGSQPGGFDCSGLIQYVYGKMGVKMPRVSNQQAASGKAVPLGQLRPGDLVAWDNSTRNNGADHVAIYLGNGMIQESPNRSTPNRVRKLGANERAVGIALNLPGD